VAMVLISVLLFHPAFDITVTAVSTERLERLLKSRPQAIDLSNPPDAFVWFCAIIEAFFVLPRTTRNDRHRTQFIGAFNSRRLLHSGDIPAMHAILRDACDRVQQAIEHDREDSETVMRILAAAVVELLPILHLRPAVVEWQPLKRLISKAKEMETEGQKESRKKD